MTRAEFMHRAVLALLDPDALARTGDPDVYFQKLIEAGTRLADRIEDSGEPWTDDDRIEKDTCEAIVTALNTLGSPAAPLFVREHTGDELDDVGMHPRSGR
jgi:hypothetical protein